MTPSLEEIGSLLKRPKPPEEVREPSYRDYRHRFAPAPEVETWARELFIDGSNEMRLIPLWNEDHSHLKLATIGFLWTNVEFMKGTHTTLGTCQMPHQKGDKWGRAAAQVQLREWFGEEPDFMITLYAPFCATCSDLQFCAVVEHELYHAGQKVDPETGDFVFTDDGEPKFAMRPHCVEQFVPIIERYGTTNDAERALVRAANAGPSLESLFGPLGDFQIVCGTCK